MWRKHLRGLRILGAVCTPVFLLFLLGVGLLQAASLPESPEQGGTQPAPPPAPDGLSAGAAYTLHLPSIAANAYPPFATFELATAPDPQPLDGQIIASTAPTVAIRLLRPLEEVTLVLERPGMLPLVPVALLPELSTKGVVTGVLELGAGGPFSLTVTGKEKGQLRRQTVSALAHSPNLVVVSSDVELPFATATGEDGEAYEYESGVILLNFVDSLEVEEVAAFLRRYGLQPLDWIADLRFVRAAIPSGGDVMALLALLESLDDPQLEAVLLNIRGDRRVALGESMPNTLSQAYKANGNADCSGAGNTWRGCFDHTAGSVTSPANVFRFHFFLDTFAAHRLSAHLLGANPNRAGLAITDSGIGHTAGAANTHARVPVADLFGYARGPFNCDAQGNDQPARTLADVRDTDGHGTSVIAAAAARGNDLVGASLHSRIRPMRDNGTIAQVTAAIVCAARHADVQVLNISWGTVGANAHQRNHMRNAVILLSNAFVDTNGDGQFTFTDTNGNGRHDPGEASEPFFDGNGNGAYDADDRRILVAAMDNVGVDRGDTSIPDGFAPAGVRTAADLLILAVCATGTQDVRGPEQIPRFAAWGARKSLSAPGDDVVLPDAAGVLRVTGGCSFAAPVVAGLAAEMRTLDRTLRPAVANRLAPLQIVEIIQATADDLGTSARLNNQLRPNDMPGDGRDDFFGSGRVNLWKAILSTANGGVAGESHPGLAATFPSLRAVADTDTRWYGFKIHSPMRGATVWIDGVRVNDASSTAPGGINAYAGVRSDRVIRIGVDGEDPTSGVVPLGSRSEFLATFSIERSDLLKANGLRILSLRRPGQGPDDAPFFNLELNLSAMRRGSVPGVVFDDFVFEVTLPDFGDGSASPTTLADNGPRHLNNMLEYIGRMNNSGNALEGVSPEHNVFIFSDPDGIPNWGVDLEDLDRYDDGVTFYPLTYVPGRKGRVDFRVCAADPGERYRRGHTNADRDRQIFVNGWIDWDTDGAFSAPEHMVNGLRLAPVITPTGGVDWSPVITGTDAIGADITLLNSNQHCGQYKAVFDVPAIGKGRLQARWRVDYGQNVGRHANSGFPNLAGLNLVAGPAYFGEVEDYFIGSDFGDAGPDGPWQSKLSSNGPRHLNFFREWIGSYGRTPSASREPDACNTNGGDQDSSENLGAGCPSANQDAMDDVAVAIIAPNTIQVDFSVSSTIRGYGFKGANGKVDTLKSDCKLGTLQSTPATPKDQRVHMRYDADNPAKRLYVNIWFDADGDGAFEIELLSAPVDPVDFGKDGAYTLGEVFVDQNKDGVWTPNESFTDAAGIPVRHFTCIFSVPTPPPPDVTQWLRIRLDYGENVGKFNVGEVQHDEEGPRQLKRDVGRAVWGEVEDFPLTAPARPIKVPTPTTVKPTETIQYTLVIPANEGLTGVGESFVQDTLPPLVQFVPGSLECTFTTCNYDPASHTVVASGPIEPGQEHLITYVVTVPPTVPPPCPPTITNSATVFDGVLTTTVEATVALACLGDS
jgi:uncharacterized repeat protein (TIGR01451 family)